MTNNPLLEKFTNPFQTIPFERIKKEHFVPAIEIAIREAENEISNIIENKNHVTFKNTILPFELSGSMLNKVSTIYFHLFGSESDNDFQSLAQEISPKLAKYNNDINLNKELFKKIEYVYENEMSSLGVEEQRLTEVLYKNFIRNGAKLNDDDQRTLRAIDQEMSTLSPKFSNNNLSATNHYELWLDKKDLDGIPELAVNAAKIAAKEKNKDNKWLFTLQMPSYLPFMKFSSRRDLREKLMKAAVTKCNKDDFDNTELCKKIAHLKHQRAMLLGYNNYADYILENRMAESQKNIYDLLDSLYEASFNVAKDDIKQIKQIAKELDGIDDLKPWDTTYYSEKLKQKLYNFNEDSLRPYFKSDKVMDGAFKVAGKMYGLEFEKLNDIETWHDDVNVYEVRDNNKHIGLLYVDLYPRETKRSGAWMNELRSQGMSEKKILRPHVTLTCNLTKPTNTKPSLLTFSEVTTIFHEFGHCLHGLLSDRKYSTLGGTSVYWDFVELPSQIMENWVGEKEALKLFAYHYETGELIPDSLIRKIKDSKNFLSATMCLRQLSFGYLDMAWFGSDNKVEDVEEFEWNAIKKTALLEKIPGASVSCSLGHIFSGGYSAGYYSYKWAEVLEADAFEKFKDDGIFNQNTAKSFRENILSQGNIKHPMELYKDFRGREPKVEALLKRDGFLVVEDI